MYRQNYSTWLIVGILIFTSLTSGCATSKIPYWHKSAYGTWKFSHADVEKLPIISIRKILSSISESDVQRNHVFVRARNLDGLAKVTRMAGEEDVFVADAHGEEVKVNLAQITEIQTVQYIKYIKRTPRQKRPGETADAVAETMIYLPLVPVAIATLPFLRAMGLDAGKSAEDDGKALMAYEGMSKNDLITYIGEPMERYHCENKYGGNEVWIYRKEQVLRGGRALFISLNDGKVYHTSYDTTFFKDSCSLLESKP